jgi:hypothetical protein
MGSAARPLKNDLFEILRSGDSKHAARILSVLEYETSMQTDVEPIVVTFLRHGDVSAVRAGTGYLAQCKTLSPATIAQLLMAIDDKDAIVRIHVAEALFAYRDRTDVGAALKAQLSRERQPQVLAVLRATTLPTTGGKTNAQ